MLVCEITRKLGVYTAVSEVASRSQQKVAGYDSVASAQPRLIKAPDPQYGSNSSRL